MSHLICSTIKILDLDILKKAVAGFGGLKWNEGATTFTSYGSTGKTKSEFGNCCHSISIDTNGAGAGYQIGVVKLHDGSGYSLVFDPIDRHAAAKVGHSCEKVAAAYSESFIRDFAERSGFICEHTTDSEGNLVLTMTDNR